MKKYFLIFFFIFFSFAEEEFCHSSESCPPSNQTQIIQLSVVICGDRSSEALVMIKSSLILTQHKIKISLFAEEDLIENLTSQLNSFKVIFHPKLEYQIYPIQFPKNEEEKWKNLFKPCSSQRIFIPKILTHIDSLIYLDTDILFLRPPEDLWNLFHFFNSFQVAGLSREHEEPNAGWYNRFARHPYVPPYGVNSGVMLMNLTLIRKDFWLEEMTLNLEKYKGKVPWGDQDLINIYFHYHPEELFVFDCNWNFRMDHCMYVSTCKKAEEEGVFILHGNRQCFHNDMLLSFKSLYNAFDFFDPSTQTTKELKNMVTKAMEPYSKTNCGKMNEKITRKLFSYL